MAVASPLESPRGLARCLYAADGAAGTASTPEALPLLPGCALRKRRRPQETASTNRALTIVNPVPLLSHATTATALPGVFFG